MITTARAGSLDAGIHAIYPPDSLADEERWAQLGANFILKTADVILFAVGIRRELGELKQRLGDGAGEQGPDYQYLISTPS